MDGWLFPSLGLVLLIQIVVIESQNAKLVMSLVVSMTCDTKMCAETFYSQFVYEQTLRENELELHNNSVKDRTLIESVNRATIG